MTGAWMAFLVLSGVAYGKLHLRQLEAIKADAPLKQVEIDHDMQVWVVGQKNVWRYSHGDHLLNKLTILPAHSREQLRLMIPSQHGLAVVSDVALYTLDFQSKVLKRRPHPNTNKDSRTLGLQRTTSGWWWIHTGGLVQYEASREKFVESPFLQKAKKALLADDQQGIWYIEGGSLLYLGLQDMHPQVVYRAKDEIVDLKSEGKTVSVFTNYQVVRIDAAQRSVAQIIPVNGKDRLVAAALNPRQHFYFFASKFLEILDLEEQTRRFRKISSLPSQVPLVQMVVRMPILAILAQDHLMTMDLNENEEKPLASARGEAKKI